MYTVLIVDDEEPVLDSYSFILEEGVDGFRLVGKARTGYEAIKLIYEHKPDIVFMDINMPGMDGIDTIAEVHEKFRDTVFVLSTAYERFDIARRAAPLGVFAYLVKPVGKKLFVDTLISIGESLDRKKPDASAVQINTSEIKFMKEQIWEKSDALKWQKCREALTLDSDRGLVCFIGLDSDQKNIFTEINAKLELKYRFFFTMYLNLGMYFFSGDLDGDELSLFVSQTVSSLLPGETLSFTGFSTLREGVELSVSCTEALDDLNRKKNSTEIKLRERMLIIQIRRKIGLSEFDAVNALFVSCWEEIFAFYEFSVAKAKMIALFILLIDDCTGYFLTHSDETPPCNPTEEIPLLANLDEWKEWASHSFSLLYAAANKKRTGKFPVPLVKALEFIDANFTSHIQLHDASEAASVSSAYLSRLFGDHMESSFIDYLTILRIELAEKMIRENRMNIKEISFSVGYQDPNYFSKIFRKIVGVSPSMYAERNRYEKE